MPFWALLGCFLHPFCGEGRADCVWKGHVWGWKCYCFKGEKTKEWENEKPLFNAQNSCSILLKSQFLSLTLGVLSSKSPTFQAQYFNFPSPNAWCFIFQKLNFPSPNAWCFISQKTNAPSPNAWCFIFQKTNFPSSNAWCFISLESNFSSSNTWCFIS